MWWAFKGVLMGVYWCFGIQWWRVNWEGVQYSIGAPATDPFRCQCSHSTLSGLGTQIRAKIGPAMTCVVGLGWFSEGVWVCVVLTLEPFAAPIRARGMVLVIFALEYALRVRGSPWPRVSGWGWTNQR